MQAMLGFLPMARRPSISPDVAARMVAESRVSVDRTQAQIAADYGVSERTLTNWKQKTASDPTFAQMVALAVSSLLSSHTGRVDQVIGTTLDKIEFLIRQAYEVKELPDVVEAFKVVSTYKLAAEALNPDAIELPGGGDLFPPSAINNLTTIEVGK